MKKRTEKPDQADELRSEYDLSKLKGRVRGKYLRVIERGRIWSCSLQMWLSIFPTLKL
jgi:hypothetical protein